MKRAMIAMSGCVDSSVAALLMQQAGCDCTGVTMRLYRAPGMERASQKSCCSDEDDAAYVCWQLAHLRFPLGGAEQDGRPRDCGEGRSRDRVRAREPGP